MSEVDRLSTSGTYPALAMTDRRRSRDGSGDAAAREGRKDGESRKEGREPARDTSAGPRPPSSLIDEYA